MDQGGAEQLLGDGDMLVEQGGDLNRVHGAYIEHSELLEIISKIKNKYSAPNYINLISPENEILNQNKDEKFEEAVNLVKNSGKASIRLLQRDLGVGHTRASRLMQQLEEIGAISQPNQEGEREIFI